MRYAGTHTVRLGRSAGEVRSALHRAGWRTVSLDGGRCATKESLLAELANALALPEWFGANWDALVDSLRETAMAEPNGLAIVIDRAEHLGPTGPTLSGIVDELADEDVRVGLYLRARPAFWRGVP